MLSITCIGPLAATCLVMRMAPVHVTLHVYTCTHIHMYMYICMQVCVCTCMYIHMHIMHTQVKVVIHNSRGGGERDVYARWMKMGCMDDVPRSPLERMK
jgi:hypothetical protein